MTVYKGLLKIAGRGITKSMVEGVLTGNITTHTHSAYSPTSHSHALLDFTGVDTAQTSLNAMAITKHLTHVSANTNQSFTVSSVSANNVAFMVVFTATGAVTVAIPTTGDYINMGDASYTLANGDIIEIHGIFSTETNKYHIKVLTK